MTYQTQGFQKWNPKTTFQIRTKLMTYYGPTSRFVNCPFNTYSTRIPCSIPSLTFHTQTNQLFLASKIMFFSTTLFQHQPGLSTVWLLATLKKPIQRRDVMDLKIAHVCKEISSPTNPLALRLSSQLMYGTVLAVDKQMSSLQSDTLSLKSRLYLSSLRSTRNINLPRQPQSDSTRSSLSLVVQDAITELPTLAGLDAPDFHGNTHLLNLNPITPDYSMLSFEEDDDLGDLDMSFDDNGLLTDNLGIDDMNLDFDEGGFGSTTRFRPSTASRPNSGVPRPITPSPHTPVNSSPGININAELAGLYEELETIQEATQTAVTRRRRRRVAAAAMDTEIALRMTDLRAFRDTYLSAMIQMAAERPRKRRKRTRSFEAWKSVVNREFHADPILGYEKEIRDLLTPQRRPGVAENNVEIPRHVNTPTSVEIGRRGSSAHGSLVSSPWSDDSRLLGPAGGNGSGGRARHSRRNSRTGSIGDLEVVPEFPDDYFPEIVDHDHLDYNMLSGDNTHEANEAQEFLVHLMSVCSGPTSFEDIVPSLASEGVPNTRATAVASFARTLHLATKGLIKLSGGGAPNQVFVELT